MASSHARGRCAALLSLLPLAGRLHKPWESAESNIKLQQLTSPAATASAVGSAQIPAPMQRPTDVLNTARNTCSAWLKSPKIKSHGRGRPYFSWVIPLADVKRGVSHRNMPGMGNESWYQRNQLVEKFISWYQRNSAR